MKTPARLLFEDQLVGTIGDISYETPWASAAVTFIDTKFFQKMVHVSSLRTFDLDVDELHLSDSEEEELWENKLAELCITCDDLKLDRDGKWSIQPIGECEQEQPMFAVRFSEEGIVYWRV